MAPTRQQEGCSQVADGRQRLLGPGDEVPECRTHVRAGEHAAEEEGPHLTDTAWVGGWAGGLVPGPFGYAFG